MKEQANLADHQSCGQDRQVTNLNDLGLCIDSAAVNTTLGFFIQFFK